GAVHGPVYSGERPDHVVELDLRGWRDEHGAEPEPHLCERRLVHRFARRADLIGERHGDEGSLRLGLRATHGELQRISPERGESVGGAVHGPVYSGERSDHVVELDLRGWWDEHGAEPEPYVYRGGELHGQTHRGLRGGA